VTSATTNRQVKSQVEAKRQSFVSGDGSAVSRAVVIVNARPELWDELTGEHAEVRTLSLMWEVPTSKCLYN
jgi:hypothetical protein